MRRSYSSASDIRKKTKGVEGKRGSKTSPEAGSLSELKPTSAAGTFQSDCGPFGVDICVPWTIKL